MKISTLALLWPLSSLSSSFVLDSYAALGDSYATGAGTGKAIVWPPSDTKCGRFTGAYPKQIVGANQGTIFRNLACGGSSTTSVLISQVPWLQDSQVSTLTIGGNEVDFFKVVNDCVFQWVPLANCNVTISHSRTIIESDYFRQNLAKLIKNIVVEMIPEARLLVTGYAKFFNEKTTQCDGVSFSRTNPENILTTGRRAELNDLVRLLNDVIKTTAIDNGAEYVDINAVFEGHRFCEEGVMEPDVQRDETWFLTLGSPMMDGGRSIREGPQYDDVQAVVRDGIPEFAVFHPTLLGQKAIAKTIMQQLERSGA
jgi:lysophospholipase L1-like esterase